MQELSNVFDKLGVKREIIYKVADEALVLGKEYAKICRKCDDTYICIYLNIVPGDVEMIVKMIALSVSVTSEREVDSIMQSLFKYSHIVISRKGLVEFYIPREYIIGVYHVVCKDTSLGWSDFELLEYEDIAHLIGDENDHTEN